MQYLTLSLEKYFDAQPNIIHLYKLFIEPVLNQREQNDSMDLILKMEMTDII